MNAEEMRWRHKHRQKDDQMDEQKERESKKAYTGHY